MDFFLTRKTIFFILIKSCLRARQREKENTSSQLFIKRKLTGEDVEIHLSLFISLKINLSHAFALSFFGALKRKIGLSPKEKKRESEKERLIKEIMKRDVQKLMLS